MTSPVFSVTAFGSGAIGAALEAPANPIETNAATDTAHTAARFISYLLGDVAPYANHQNLVFMNVC